MNFKNLNHKHIWSNSLTGMTWGFIMTLIVGTIIGLFGLYSNNNIFVSIKLGLTFATPFGIGVGIGIKQKMSGIKIISIGIASFVVARSMIVPSYNAALDKFIFNNIEVNINLALHLPGDVFSAWLTGVLMVYLFEMYSKKTYIDIFLIPISTILISIFLSLWLTYLTTLVTILFEWIIDFSINDRFWLGIILAPIFGAIMGLALTLPTSSAAIAFALFLKGDAAIVAIAATAGQMMSWGFQTLFFTRNIPKSLAVGFGTPMLQLKNIARKPTLLIIPTIVSALGGLIAMISFHNQLPFPTRSVTSGMGTCVFYGQIYTMIDNGLSNYYSWINVFTIQLILPIILSLPMLFFAHKKNWFNKNDLEIRGTNG